MHFPRRDRSGRVGVAAGGISHKAGPAFGAGTGLSTIGRAFGQTGTGAEFLAGWLRPDGAEGDETRGRSRSAGTISLGSVEGPVGRDRRKHARSPGGAENAGFPSDPIGRGAVVCGDAIDVDLRRAHGGPDIDPRNLGRFAGSGIVGHAAEVDMIFKQHRKARVRFPDQNGSARAIQPDGLAAAPVPVAGDGVGVHAHRKPTQSGHTDRQVIRR